MKLVLIGALCIAAIATGTLLGLGYNRLAVIPSLVGMLLTVYLTSWVTKE